MNLKSRNLADGILDIQTLDESTGNLNGDGNVLLLSFGVPCCSFRMSDKTHDESERGCAERSYAEDCGFLDEIRGNEMNSLQIFGFQSDEIEDKKQLTLDDGIIDEFGFVSKVLSNKTLDKIHDDEMNGL
jgi:hypothetical protein